jgi:hypothetical protein
LRVLDLDLDLAGIASGSAKRRRILRAIAPAFLAFARQGSENPPR